MHSETLIIIVIFVLSTFGLIIRTATIMGILYQHKLTTKPNQTSSGIFESLFLPNDFTNIPFTTPKDYVNQYWDAYLASGSHDNSVNGHVFEYIIETLLIRTGVLPFYTQAIMSFVPAIKYDVMLYSEDSKGSVPYLLSLKTSFRERWKQADLEAEALKNVHRRAKCFLLTISSEDARDVKDKIASGEAFAIDDAIDCTSDDINSLIAKLQAIHFIESIPNIQAVNGGHFIQ